MAGCRVLATRSFLSHVVFPTVFPNRKQICRPGSHSQLPNSVFCVGNKWCPKVGFLKSGFHDGCPEHIKKIPQLYDWNGVVMLIVGASTGIGADIIRLSLQEGAKQVANLDTDDKRGLALQYELNQKYQGQRVKYIHCDINDEEQLIENIQSVLSDCDTTYVIVNNAGPMCDCVRSKEEIEASVAALVTGSLTALEMMRKDEDGKGGAIINMCPVTALCPIPLTSGYNPTRNAVLTFTHGLGHDVFCSKTGVRVMTVCYGALDTSSSKASSKRRSLSAARTVIDIYKHGETGSTWLSKENKPTEDITPLVKQFYSVIREPKF